MKRDRFKPVFGEPITRWYPWFAWRPVDTVDRGWRWLCFVQRRRIQLYPYLNSPFPLQFQHVVEVDA